MTRLTLVVCAAALAAGSLACKSTRTRKGDNLSQAQSAYDAGEYDRCVSLCTAAIESGASPAPAHMLRGKAYERQGDYSHAVSDFEKVRRAEPTRGEAAFRQARCHLALGQYESAETVMEWCIGQMFDSFATRDQMFAHAVYGEVQLATGNFPRAIEQFESALKVARSSRALAADGATSIVYYNLSRAQFERNNFRRAKEAYIGYLNAKQRGDGNVDADDLYTLGVLHFLCGEIKHSNDVTAKLPADHQRRMREVLSGEAFSVRALYDQTRPDPNENEHNR